METRDFTDTQREKGDFLGKRCFARIGGEIGMFCMDNGKNRDSLQGYGAK